MTPLILNLKARWRRVVINTPLPFNSAKERCLGPRAGRTRDKSLASTGTGTPDRPVRSLVPVRFQTSV